MPCAFLISTQYYSERASSSVSLFLKYYLMTLVLTVSHSSLLQFSSNYISSYTRHFRRQFPYASKICKDQLANSKFGYQIIAAVGHFFLLAQPFLKWKPILHQANPLIPKHTHISLTKLAHAYGKGWGSS